MADIDKNFEGMAKYGWPLSFQMTGKFPLLTKRIFSTLANAQAFIDDLNDTAIPGIILSVIDDVTENNGAYFVKSVATSDNPSGILVKIGSETSSDLTELAQRVTKLENKVFKIILTTGQFNESTYEPIIENPDEDVVYLVPIKDAGSNQYIEWSYIKSTEDGTGYWEMIGSPIDVITNDDIDNIINNTNSSI